MRAKSTHMGLPVMCAFCVPIAEPLLPEDRGGGADGKGKPAELTPEPQTRGRVAVRRAVSVRRPRRRKARQGAGPAQRNTPQASPSQSERCCQGRRGAATAAVARTERDSEAHLERGAGRAFTSGNAARNTAHQRGRRQRPPAQSARANARAARASLRLTSIQVFDAYGQANSIT